MKKQALTLAIAFGLAGCFMADAVPAKLGLREVAQPDGTTIRAELAGDENFHYYLSEDGLPLSPTLRAPSATCVSEPRARWSSAR